MPYASMRQVPPNLKKLEGARLTLEQVNSIARCADSLIAEGRKKSSAWAICIAAFKKSHVRKGDRWVKRQR